MRLEIFRSSARATKTLWTVSLNLSNNRAFVQTILELATHAEFNST
jgi:hypothetical protein